ncbi:MAG: hypothetical protein JWN02_817 [Acidobacteria bacterium]|nr:hypothetical protein [Acidobacteriota bacterium]
MPASAEPAEEGRAEGGARTTPRRSSLRLIVLDHSSAAAAYGAVALMVLWAAHDGGYDADTWYWGALVMVALLAWIGPAARIRELGRPATVALVAFALYLVWSYASIAWAAYPGDALTGSNRTLLYFLVFAAFLLTPWRPRQALATLSAYAVSIGVIGAVLLGEMATHQSALALFREGRLFQPTGYFNSNAALFMAASLVSVALSVRRELPAILRGVLLAVACCGLDLALLAQSRGWLFTLPVVLVASAMVSRDRLRVAAAAILPTLGALAAVPSLLDVYRASTGANARTATLVSAAGRAGRISLLFCGAVLVSGTVLAAVDSRSRVPGLSIRWRRTVGTALAGLALAGGVAGATAATHGHPFRFMKNQWHGFTHPSASTSNGASHFADIGSGRYDAWRVSIKAVLAHPLGGLGQDNFADYYIRHRKTGLELQWTHSLEMRLLAHTGFAGTILFGVFIAGALAAALTGRRRASALSAAVGGAGLLPLVVWLIHGSVDWFWEIPALGAPALGFLAMAGGISAPHIQVAPRVLRRAPAQALRMAGAGLALVLAVAVLGFPYLSVREVSLANDLRRTNPIQALADLHTAAALNPLNADPGRIGGTISLQAGLFAEAQRRFEQATTRKRGGWYAWLGAGLAASALGERYTARRDFQQANAINPLQPAVREALAKVSTNQPLTPEQALNLLVVVY